MGFFSFGFFLLLAVSLVLYHLSSSERRRRLILGAASAFFFASYAADWRSESGPAGAALSLGGILAFALLAFWVQKNAPALSNALFAGAIVLLIGVYILFKHGLPTASMFGTSAAMTTVGLSYILFRTLHLALDRRDGLIDQPLTPRSYGAYLFFWDTFLSGPIWRYQDYSGQMAQIGEVRLSRGQAFGAFSRIASGGVKALAVAKAMLYCRMTMTAWAAECPPDAAGPALAGALHAAASLLHLLYIYFDFSGYTDLAVGLGGLFGLRVPENFNRPFACSGVLDFWSKWHMTLTQWMQRYFFNPLTTVLTRKYGSKGRTPFLGALGYLATFTILGLWHDASVGFVAFGVVMGLAASANKLWDTFLPRAIGKKKMGELKAGRIYPAAIGAVGIFLVAFSLSFSWLDRPFAVWGGLAALAGAALAGPPAAAAIALLFRLVDFLKRRADPAAAESPLGRAFRTAAAEVWLAAKGLAFLGLLLMQGDQPPFFLYQGY